MSEEGCRARTACTSDKKTTAMEQFRSLTTLVLSSTQKIMLFAQENSLSTPNVTHIMIVALGAALKEKPPMKSRYAR